MRFCFILSYSASHIYDGHISESDDEENNEEECEEQDSSSHKIEKNETVHDNSEQLDNSNVSESKPT